MLDRDSDTSGEEWSAFLSPSEIDGIEATCAIELGRPAHAERLLEGTIASYEQRFARNLADWRVRLARAHREMGAVDGAAEAARSVLDDKRDEVAAGASAPSWTRGRPADRFPSISGPFPGDLFWIGVSKSERRPRGEGRMGQRPMD